LINLKVPSEAKAEVELSNKAEAAKVELAIILRISNDTIETMESKYLTVFLLGVALLGGGVVIWRMSSLKSDKVEIVEATSAPAEKDLAIEISGSVKNAGVYNFSKDNRVEDAINAAGGLTENANEEYLARILNRAAKLVDGQKIYIPNQSEDVSAKFGVGEVEASGGVLGVSNGSVNINMASASELDKLSGIGPVYAQKIIENRPYSSVDELTTRDVIPKNVYEKNKDKLSIY
jgi:competence protein ComEA